MTNPDRALTGLTRLLQRSSDPRPLLRALVRSPRFAQILTTVLSGSQYLTEILLQHPAHAEVLSAPGRLATPRRATQLLVGALAATAPLPSFDAQLAELGRYQRLEMLRIGACDLLGMWDIPVVTAQLSYLAEALLNGALAAAAQRRGLSPSQLAVIALGKLGGAELNYSSDIDLLFVAESAPPQVQRLAADTIAALDRPGGAGPFYRVDLRLRPWGSAGPLVPSLEAYIGYLRRYARPWELQALLKARVVAGNSMVGEALLRRAAPLLLGSDGQAVRAEIARMKERIEDGLTERGTTWGEVKLGVGSIRDIEFVTQSLQLAHGETHPRVLSPNTLAALGQLAQAGLLSTNEHRILTEGYAFLRSVEHYLQLMHGRQVHTLPTEPSALDDLARRLGFGQDVAGESMVERYEQHRQAIRAVYERHLQAPSRAAQAGLPQGATDEKVTTHVDRMASSYRETFSPGQVAEHARAAAELQAPQCLAQVSAHTIEPGRWRVEIVALDYPGELALICGLMFAHGLDIEEGHAFTYERDEREPHSAEGERSTSQRRKIVDVFTVRETAGPSQQDRWAAYAEELQALLALMETGQDVEAQTRLARRVVAAVGRRRELLAAFRPIETAVSQQPDGRYTVLHIDAPDTVGFLYEFCYALALSGYQIARVTVDSVAGRARDAFWLTDTQGDPIATHESQRALIGATLLVAHFTHLLPLCADPERGLLHFRAFLGDLVRRPGWADELASLDRPDVLAALARLLGVSDHLWEDMLRLQYSSLFPVLRDTAALAQGKTRDQLRQELYATLSGGSEDEPESADTSTVDRPTEPEGETCPRAGSAHVGPRWQLLNAWKDRALFRADLRHIEGHTPDLPRFSAELTDIAQVVLSEGYALAHEAMRSRHGTPLDSHGQPCPAALFGLGKLGGGELGYASDIELVVIYAENGHTTGPEQISTAEFYDRLVAEMVTHIAARRAGIFELDLRLRPYGDAGSLAVSLDAFRRYYAPDGPAWPYERQALVKLRHIDVGTGAAQATLGRRVEELRDAYVYRPAAFDLRAMRALRERQLRHLVGGGSVNAKFGPGGLVDVEYLVQGLQMIHGEQDPAVRETNTLAALRALAHGGYLTEGQHTELSAAYTFLRRVIDALRMVRGNARDLTVPTEDPEALAGLTRRMGRAEEGQHLLSDLAHHMSRIVSLGQLLLTAA